MGSMNILFPKGGGASRPERAQASDKGKGVQGETVATNGVRSVGVPLIYRQNATWKSA